MKNIHKRLFKSAVVAMLLCGAAPIQAQYSFPEDKASMFLTSASDKTVDYKAQTIHVDFMTNNSGNITATSDVSWIKPNVKPGKGCAIAIDVNYSPMERTGSVTFISGTVVKTISITQKREGTAEYVLMGDIIPTSASDNNHQGGSDISLTIDGNTNTIYHSQWGGGNVTKANPAILTYEFSNAPHIDYINYIPRSGGGNGCFGELMVEYRVKGSTSYTKLGDYDFKKSSTMSTIVLGDNGIDDITGVRFTVYTGTNTENSNASYASCAEMQFRTNIKMDGDYEVFTDELMTGLKPEVTQETINGLTNPFVKNLAAQMYEGLYSTDFRVGKYNCLLDPNQLSAEWSTPGKLYDQIQGVTGIMMQPGRSIVTVKGLESGKSVTMTVVCWYQPPTANDTLLHATNPDHSLSVGKGYTTETYALRNGINVINRTSTSNGLAYICYYDYAPETRPEITVHFINGTVQGYLSPDKSNSDMDKLLKNAPYQCIDVYGTRVHSIWETKGLINYCKDKNGSIAYRQYLNVLDTLIAWEHRLLGFEKYNRIPKNKTMAYVNYTYYMFQGGFGVSFMYDTQSRCVSPKNIMYYDDDVVWGLSHEWGHQHQMQPYFCWAGLSESSNNMNSCYNVLHMGYPGSRVKSGWANARNLFLNDTPDNDGYGRGKISQKRKDAYNRRSSNFAWNKSIYEMANSMADSLVYAQKENSANVEVNLDKAISINECYVESNLAPFYMLYTYFTNKGIVQANNETTYDFGPDMYESLRGTDTSDDKYAILAAAQNHKTGKFEEFQSKYPTSCWVQNTDGSERSYVSASSGTWENSVPYIFNYVRKASLLTGYNLYPYFEKWGFFRTIAMAIDDYGYKYYCLLPDMKAEFKADMEALGLKVMPEDMVDEIANIEIPNFPTPNIPN